MTVAARVAAVGLAGSVLVGVPRALAVQRPAPQADLAIVRVTSAPKGKGPLSSRRLNVVVASPNLVFQVALRNQAARRRLTITVTVTRSHTSVGPMVRSKDVSLGAHQFATVMVGPFPHVLFAQRERLKVSVAKPRRREVWTMVYPVIFSLG